MYKLDIGGTIESGSVPKQHSKPHYVNGQYDLFDFTALLLHGPQNITPSHNRDAIARGKRLKTKHSIEHKKYPLLKAGSARSGFSGPHPVRFWICPRIQTPQPCLAMCTTVFTIFALFCFVFLMFKCFFLCFSLCSLSSSPVIGWHWEKSGSFYFTPPTRYL